MGAKIKGVVLVFELATDAHIPKDVIQAPLTLARMLGTEFTVLTRPSNAQKQLKDNYKVILLGDESIKNNELYKINKPENLEFSNMWYIQACKLAAEYGSVLMLYPHFGNPVKGAWCFKLRKFVKLENSFVYLKMDADPRKTASALGEGVKAIVKRKIERIRCWPLNYISAETPHTVNYTRNRFHCEKNKVHLIRNCPDDLDIFYEKGSSNRPRNFLTVGRLGTKQKATETILESWLQVCADLPDWTLTLAGTCPDDFKRTWIERLKSKGQAERVLWVPEIKDRRILADLYQNASVFLISSRHESGPLVLFEAVASGCSVISTPVGEVDDFFGAETTGLYPIDDFFALGEKMKLFANNYEIRIRQSKTLRAKLKNRTWDFELKHLMGEIQKKMR